MGMSADLAAVERLVQRCCGLAERAHVLSQTFQSVIQTGVELPDGPRWAVELSEAAEALTACLRWLQDLLRHLADAQQSGLPPLPAYPPACSGPVGLLASDVTALLDDLAEFGGPTTPARRCAGS